MNRIISEECRKAFDTWANQRGWDCSDVDFQIWEAAWNHKALQPPSGQVGEASGLTAKDFAVWLWGKRFPETTEITEWERFVEPFFALRQPVETVGEDELLAGFREWNEGKYTAEEKNFAKQVENRLDFHCAELGAMAFYSGAQFALRTQPQAPRPGQNRFGVDYDDGGFKVHCKDRGVVLHLSHDEAEDLVSQLPQPQAPVVEVSKAEIEKVVGEWIKAPNLDSREFGICVVGPKSRGQLVDMVHAIQFQKELVVWVPTLEELRAVKLKAALEWLNGSEDRKYQISQSDFEVIAIRALLQSKGGR